MTAPPQLITRSLTFNFAPTVSAATGLPDVLDISVIPLSSSPDEAAGATFAGGLRSTQIELSAPVNSWTINLIPSNSPGLSAPINYRVLWRAGVMGPTTTYDFAMPDQDLTFDALMGTTGDIIDGTVYLQQSDLGVPGRVARLDNAGNVINAEGVICATEADVTAVSNALIAETNARSVAVNGLNTTLQAQIASQAPR
jgi:hypothetical protein